MPDPKLEEAEKIIRDVIKNYDLGGSFVLTTKENTISFVEYPKWSIFKAVNNGVSMRFDPSVYKDEKAQNEVLKDSLYLLQAQKESLGGIYQNYHSIDVSFQKQVEKNVTKTRG